MSVSSSEAGEGNPKAKRYWLPTVILSIIIIIVIGVVLYNGWCTGDEEQSGNSATLSNHPDPESCRDAAARVTSGDCAPPSCLPNLPMEMPPRSFSARPSSTTRKSPAAMVRFAARVLTRPRAIQRPAIG